MSKTSARNMASSMSISLADSTSTATISRSGSTFLEFTSVQNTTVCGEGFLSWDYGGNDSYTLPLNVTNVRVAGADQDAQPITHQLLDNIVGVSTCGWSPVISLWAHTQRS